MRLLPSARPHLRSASRCSATQSRCTRRGHFAAMLRMQRSTTRMQHCKARPVVGGFRVQRLTQSGRSTTGRAGTATGCCRRRQSVPRAVTSCQIHPSSSFASKRHRIKPTAGMHQTAGRHASRTACNTRGQSPAAELQKRTTFLERRKAARRPCHSRPHMMKTMNRQPIANQPDASATALRQHIALLHSTLGAMHPRNARQCAWERRRRNIKRVPQLCSTSCISNAKFARPKFDASQTHPTCIGWAAARQTGP